LGLESRSDVGASSACDNREAGQEVLNKILGEQSEP